MRRLYAVLEVKDLANASEEEVDDHLAVRTQTDRTHTTFFPSEDILIARRIG